MPRDTAEAPAAEKTLLAYVNDQEQGLTRLGKPGAFAYADADGRPVRDEATLDRIRALAIPPAWTSVWICPDPNGHIQAVGRDQKGRKQYRYHPDWRADRDARKYERMAAFGRALPRLRKRVEADLARRGLPREKVLAAVVRLLELTLIRVGNDEYAKTNKSFGLTTMQKRHLKLAGGGAMFEFKGKSGKVHRTGFRDRRLARIVRACQDLRGQRLFQYLDEEGQRRSIESHDVNDYIRAVAGEDFSAKDFRTWYGSLAALEALSLQPAPATRTEAKKALNLCIKAVAGLLGNTPAVCRAAYIHPRVLEAFETSGLPKRRASSERARELALLRLVAS
ncbi:DNA topoisomerase [Caulobacter flavus]|jgi:DNA topoisomerase-1|uniref:DNA topoisomerase n=1 Tax=Caulobacter flavus TaxID=1679497 RepID=A0A2N5D547_9CAUL|nr:DNA topoisomerase IB [Caulobacter flavus]AYV49578.1 DNA topoisomerase [Caulobacter flavus]PLR21173.1 DNA topoisomerase [Caulobacter flavus]